MPDEHARFSPSARERWSVCTASILYSEKLIEAGTVPEDESSDDALKGQALHTRAEHHLVAGTDPAGDRRPYSTTYGEGKRRNWPNAENEQDIVCTYVDYVRDLQFELQMKYGEENVFLEIEKQTRLNEECWGTVDAALFVPGEELHVIDLKTGAGHMVDAIGNPQLDLYLAMKANEAKWGFKRYVSHIVQPPRGTLCDPSESTEDYLKQVLADTQAAMAEALNGGEFEAGDHCRWCPSKYVCQAREREAVAVFPEIDLATVGVKDLPAHVPPEDMPVDKLAWVMRNLPTLKAFIKDYEKHAFKKAMNEPGSVPGFKIVGNKGNRKLKGDQDEILAVLRKHKIPTERPCGRASRP